MHPVSETMEQEGHPQETERTSRILQCLPPKEKVYLHISHLMMFLLTLSVLYGILDKDVLPGSEIFALILLYVLAVIAGKIAGCLKLPPLLGMLLTGFSLRNLPPFLPFYYSDISIKWASTLRGSALVIILLKAGLGLDAEKLKQLKAVVLLLAFTPCLVETVTVGITSHYLLYLPWMWALLLGFVLSAVSPAVVVPSLLNLQEKHYGTEKGVPTLVIAAASVDDILAITGFTIMLSMSLSGDSWLWSLSKGILEPLAGFIFGVAFGCILWYIPDKGMAKPPLKNYRVILLCSGGLAVFFISKILDFGGAGPFGCLILGFVASIQWKKDSAVFPAIEASISFLWIVLQPFLFSLIGCEVTITSLEKSIGNSILLLIIGLFFRTLAAFIVTFGGDFNLKEQVFIALAWLPKATVQAAIGPQALDYVLTYDKPPELEEYAKKVLTVAVLSILLTAPVGAVLINLLGPILLSNDKDKRFNCIEQTPNCATDEIHLEELEQSQVSKTEVP